MLNPAEAAMRRIDDVSNFDQGWLALLHRASEAREVQAMGYNLQQRASEATLRGIYVAISEALTP
jgi:hypothetical protein